MAKTDIEAMRASNRAPKEKVEDLIQRIEANEQDIVDKRMANMAAMKPFYADREELYAEAKSNGIHTKALKKVVQHRLALRKLIAAAEKMDEVTADEYEFMRDQMDLFGVVPVSETVQEEHDAEKAALTDQIEALKKEISALEDAAEFDAPEDDKPRLKAVK